MPRDLEDGQLRDLGAGQPRDLGTGQPRDFEADKHYLMIRWMGRARIGTLGLLVDVTH